MKKRSQGFRILFIGGIFFLLGTNFLAILFPTSNQNYKNYWYSSVGFELIPTTYADDDEEDEDRENRKEGKRDREDHEDESRDREDHKDNDEDDYYYIPPVSPTPTNPTTPTPANPPSTTCRTVYDTVTSASGVKSQVPRQVCDTTTPTSPTVPEKIVTPTPVPEKVIQKPVTPVSPTPTNPTTPTPANPPSNNCRTLYETVYDTITTASGTQKQEPRQISRQVCDTATPVAPVVTPEKVVTPPTPVAPAKPIPPVTQKNPPAPITGIYTNGTYRGDGYYSYAGGNITYTVSLTLESSKITEAHFIAFTPSGNGRYTRADGDAMLATLVRSQNTSIDTVTGATGTSQAVQDAINIALRKARGENVTITPPVVSRVLLATSIPQSIVSPYVESTLIQSSDDAASGYISDTSLPVVALSDFQNSAETSITPSDENTILSDIVIQESGDSIPTSRLIERIATRDGRAYSIIKGLESGKYILLDEKNGKEDPHTFQFKQDAIMYITTSEPIPQTFIERVFQFFTSLFSGPSGSPVIVESSIITKTKLLAQADVQTRTMERKMLKQKIAEAIARSEITQSEIQNNQKPTIVPTASVQKNIVPVVQKTTAQVAPKKAVAPVQKTVPKKSAVNTVTQAS